MNEKSVSVTMKKRLQKYALTGIKIAILVLLCFMSANFIGPESKYAFLINVIASSVILYYIVRMIYKRAYAQCGKKILSVVILVIAANHLYLYENIVQMFPTLANVNKGTMLLLLLLTFVVIFLVGCLARYISAPDSSDKMNHAEAPQNINQYNVPKQESNRRGVGSTIAKVIGILLTVAAIGASLWLYFKLDLPQLISDNPIENLSSFVSSLVGYLASILFVLFALALVFIALVEVLRVLIQRIALFRVAKKNDEADNSSLAFAFSILLVFAALLLMYKVSDLTLLRVTDELVAGDYLAIPLVVLVGIVVVILMLRVTYGILLLLMKPSPLPSKEDFKKFAEATKIKQYTIEIGRLIIRSVLGTVKSVLSFVEFVPDFFETLSVLVVPHKENEENEEHDADKGEEKGIKIVTIAAFCFALVSFVATANGLNNYVFTEAGQKYQAYLISFGIQSILFVFNLKLPSYFAHIGSLVPDEKKEKTKKGRYKWTFMQKVIAIFYAIVICSSSIFSYVYIANAVYAKTRYDDANIILDNRYRILFDDTKNYIDEAINYHRLHIAKQLGEVQDLVPKNDQKKSELELQNEKIQAEKLLAAKKLEQKTAENDYNIAMEKYLEPMALRWRSDEEWEKERQDYERAKTAFEQVNAAVIAAEETLAKVELEIVNFKPSASTVVRDFLVEMLQPEPSIDDYVKDDITYNGLNTYIKQLNDCVVVLDEEQINMEEFSKLVSKTSELSILVENYIAYTTAQEQTIVETTITIPAYGDDNYEQQIRAWEKVWRKRYEQLEEVVKKLPEYTEASEEDQEEFGDVVHFEILSEFHPKEVIDEIDDLQRKNFSTINHFERAGNLLVSEYSFLAWFSLGLAFFFDLASLLAGLFIYYVSKKKESNN